MLQLPSNRYRRGHALAVVILSACGVLTCAPSDEAWLRARVLHAEEPVLRSLFRGDDVSFRAVARDAGARSIAHLERSLCAALDSGSPRAWRESRRRVLPFLKRVVSCEAEQFGFEGGEDWIRRIESLTDEEGIAFTRCLEHHRRIVRSLRAEAERTPPANDPDGAPAPPESPHDPGVELSALAGELDRLGFAVEAARVRVDLARLGEESEREARIREALVAARRARRASLVCEALGDLAALDARRGELDSLAVHLQEATTLAVTHRLPQAADLAYFHSGLMQGRGRQGLAAELREAAVRLGREFGSGAREVDFLLMALSIHADYGNWHLVERDLRRAESVLPLVQDAETAEAEDEVPSGVFPGPLARHEETRRSLRVYEGRRLMQAGLVEEAEEVFRALLATPGPGETKEETNDALEDVALFFHWGRGLLDNGLAARALEPIQRGIEISDRQERPALAQRFRMLRLEAELLLGGLDQAEATFRIVFASAMLRHVDAWTELDADLLHARFARAQGDLSLAWSLASRTYDRWSALAASAEPSTEPHREVDVESRLWEVVRDLAGSDDRMAYGCELVRSARYLSSAYDELGLDMSNERGAAATGELDAGASSNLDAAADLRAMSSRARERILQWAERTGGAHLLYRIGRVHVQRWCATASGVRNDTLRVTPDELRDRIAQAVERMARDPVDPETMIEPDLAAALAELGETLLPPEVSTSSTVLVTADDFLRLLPFEALGTPGSGGYFPLLEQHAVAYLRGTRSLSPARGGSGLIVSDPTLADDLRRRYPTLVELKGDETEALTAKSPEAVVLRGDEATKANLRAVWTGADWIYYAGHLVRDPENPFWTFLPLAMERRSPHIEDSRLEILDIRRAALSACRLVALSGCRSGAPHVARGNTMPSIADAFVDAGAHAVTFAFWDVRDDAVAQLMLPFFEEWNGGDPGPDALARAKRRLLRTPTGVRHPFGWAVYGIQVAGVE